MPMNTARERDSTKRSPSGSDGANLLRAAHGFDEPVGKLDAFIESLNSDAFVAPVSAIFVHVHPHSADAIARHAGVPCLPIVAEAGRYGGNDRHMGPHRRRKN